MHIYSYVVEKSYTTGRLGASPGSVTWDPTPKDLTLNPFFLRMLWASMLLFMLLIQTTATLSGEEGMAAVSWDSSWTRRLQGLRGTLKAREMTGWVQFEMSI